MGLNDLAALAERYIGLVKETEDVRAQMRRLLANGSDPHPADPQPIARPTLARRLGETKKPQASIPAAASAKGREARMVIAAQEEARIMEILSSNPLRTSEAARLTGSALTTCAARLARLQARGLVSRDADERWSASAAPS